MKSINFNAQEVNTTALRSTMIAFANNVINYEILKGNYSLRISALETTLNCTREDYEKDSSEHNAAALATAQTQFDSKVEEYEKAKEDFEHYIYAQSALDLEKACKNLTPSDMVTKIGEWFKSEFGLDISDTDFERDIYAYVITSKNHNGKKIVTSDGDLISISNRFLNKLYRYTFTKMRQSNQIGDFALNSELIKLFSKKEKKDNKKSK